MFKIGVAKTDITAYVKGVGMLGYGMYFNTMEGIETRLYCRAFVFEDEQKNKTAIAICELGFITISLKRGILKNLLKYSTVQGLNDENLVILAQHTHSGPGGYSHHGLYNMSTPGFVPEIYNLLCKNIAQAIIEADERLTECHLSLRKGMFPEDWNVAFNRSLKAYSNNKDIEILSHEERHKAVNREMSLLNIQNKEKKSVASLNWFGVHTTSISNDNHLVNSDNKGYAASLLEQTLNTTQTNYIGAFAQGACGDVTPKFIYNKKRKAQRGYWEGQFEDDIKSAEYNGELQFKKAIELIQETKEIVIEGDIKCSLRYFDFSDIAIDKEYSGTTDIQYTSPSCLGMSFLCGAQMDGPGAPPIVGLIGRKAADIVKRYELFLAKNRDDEFTAAVHRKYKTQGKKDIVIESGAQRILGSADIKNSLLPGIFDESIKTFKELHRSNSLGTKPWTPQILPIQLIQIGNLVLAAFPFEISTVAGYRLKKAVQELYNQENSIEVILCPYANSYSGYITTYEEYQVQMYEGGHSVFGEYNLAALQTTFKSVHESKNIPFESLETKVTPPEFSEEEINKRLFYKRKYYERKERRIGK